MCDMFSKYLIFIGVILSMYDTKQINYFKCSNYDHLLLKEDDLLLPSVKRSYGKKSFKDNVISCELKEVIIL